MENTVTDRCRRALAAYYKSGGTEQASNVYEDVFDDRQYLIVQNMDKTLAVFRYIEQRDVLKRLKRVPKGLIEWSKI